jgi:hypothetical protein
MAAARKTELQCPHRDGAFDPELIKRVAGKVVGSIKGEAKARTSAVARAAAMKRWAQRKDAE